ncbi:class I SAM-dependent methyltransferase [Luteolibacter yonseiensis]|uniref:Class I SAM-dependent methyltransferase n=1 Tax=Luteolibacter yonseiensis TaxID=1144680 RepID=A0A934VB71_9BACT|nr:class I SAM-dependent methyltransferase [Luteolibacter yonseiensis]MBK1815855.1 class I SAM-dependent methyltransferase [Luteolibacter yonseiensis]
MIQRIPFQESPTAGDVARLRVLLRDALTTLKFHRAGKITVLNLACGRADETGALAAALAPAEISHYLGIDLRATAIEEAAKRWKSEDGGSIEFRTGDASSIHRMKQLPAFDFIFIRHQNYWHHPAVWDRLLGNALAALAPDGLLACTSYFDREHELLKASLRTRGAEILWDVRHPDSRPLNDAPGKSVDRRLAVFSNLPSP